MTENECRQWLNRAFYADRKAMALESEVMHCREFAQRITACWNSSEASGSTKNSTEDALLRLVEKERKLAQQVIELFDVRDEISAAIDSLNDDDLETVLIHRYLLFHTVEQTADELNYHPNTVKNKIRKAVSKLCTELS